MFGHKNRGTIVPVVKLRHAEVAVVDGIHGGTDGMRSSRYRIVW